MKFYDEGEKHTYRKWGYVSIYVKAYFLVFGLFFEQTSQPKFELTCLTLAVTVYLTNAKAGPASQAI